MPVQEGQKTLTREQLMVLHKELCDTARELMSRKNRDYGADEDPFRNFRTFGRIGILVRMSDKLARLRSFTENGKFFVEDEGVQDTIKDIINYAVLFAGYDD